MAHALAARLWWLVPALLLSALVVGALLVDHRVKDAGRLVAQTAVEAAAMAAASDPAKGERLVAEALAGAGYGAATQFLYERGRVDGSAFTAEDGTGTAVRVAVDTYLDPPVATFFGFPQPVYRAEAVAMRSGAAIVELGRSAARPGPVGRRLLSVMSGFTVDLDAAAWDSLDRTKVPLDRFLAAVGGAENGGAAAGLPIGTAVEALGIAALPDGPTARETLSRLTALAATSPVLVDLAGQYGFPAGTPTLPQSTATDVLLAIIRAAIASDPIEIAMDLPAEGILAIKATLRVRSDAGVARITMADADHPLSDRAIDLSLVTTVPAGALPGVASVEIPVRLALDPADVRIAAIDCAKGSGARIAAVSGAARIRFASPDGKADERDGRLIDAKGLKAWIAGDRSVERGEPVSLTFTSEEIATGRTENARSAIPFGLLVGRLLDTPAVTVSVLDQSLEPPAARQEAVELVRDAAPFIASTLDDILTSLGIAAGEVQVRVHDTGCTRIHLVEG